MDSRIRELYTDEELELIRISDFLGNLEYPAGLFNLDIKDIVLAMSESDFDIGSIMKHPYTFPRYWEPEDLKEEFLDGGVNLETLPYYRQKIL